MSLSIDIARVTDVLLEDGWHEVEDQSFDLDAYEYVQEWENYGEKKSLVIHPGGHAGVCRAGFLFKENGAVLMGPLTAILAVRSK